MRLFELVVGEGPIVATAIHAGHELRPGIKQRIALDEVERLREEDPFTDRLAILAPTYLVGRRSRFELDLNRPREKAVYCTPDEAWGLQVWHEDLPHVEIAESLSNHDLFFATVRGLLQQLIRRWGRIVVLDLHSYNHCRDGRGNAANPHENPEINVGTGSLDRTSWGPVVERFMTDLKNRDALGREIDVRENVKFFGGHFPQWINATFPGQACAIAVEFKKTFMDEWTGELDSASFARLQSALRQSFPGILAALAKSKVSAAVVA